jgi:hypothetical protein
MSAVDPGEIDLFGRDERWAFAYTGVQANSAPFRAVTSACRSPAYGLQPDRTK